MSIKLDLNANIREKLGSSESRRIRKSGNIPAIIYNKGVNTQISVPSKEFEKEYFKGNIFTTLITLIIKGKKQEVVVNKIDIDPVKDIPSHITFIKAEDIVKARVRVKFFNKEKSPGIKKGGFLNIIKRKVDLLCPANEIPEEIKVNVSKMKVGDNLKSSDLDIPKNTSFTIKDRDFTIASITGRGSKEEEDNNLDGTATAADAAEGSEVATEEGKKEA